LLRTAEKILYVDSIINPNGVRRSDLKDVNIAYVGNVTLYDIMQLWALITNPETWGLEIENPQMLENRLKLTFFTKSNVEAHVHNITIRRDIDSVHDVPYNDYHLVFMLDCDGLYDDRIVSRAKEFHYLRTHKERTLTAPGCFLPYANGMNPENTMFYRAFLLLDSLSYAGKTDNYQKRVISFEKLRYVSDKLYTSSARNDSTEIYVYAFDTPNDNALDLYKDHKIRICRKESLSSDNVTVLRVSNYLPAEKINNKKESPLILTISLWQLLKGFDSNVADWIGFAKLPPSFSENKTVGTVFLPKEKSGVSAWVCELKKVQLVMNYENLLSDSDKKMVTYHLKYSKEILKRAEGNPEDFLRLDCYLKKLVADFFSWVIGVNLPVPNHPIVVALRDHCKGVLRNSIMGSCKSVEDMFFYYAFEQGGWFLRNLKWLYDKEKKHASNTQSEEESLIPKNYVDRYYYVQVMRLMDAPMFTLGNDTFLNNIPLCGLSDVARANNRVCVKVNYAYSSLYDISRRYMI